MGANKLKQQPNYQTIASGSAPNLINQNLFLTANAAISQSIPNWQIVVIDKLQELIRLEEGWDGYLAFPVSFESAMFAYKMLESISNSNTPAPQIVPGTSGDLQIEWHLLGGEIELWVRGPNSVHAWCQLHNRSEQYELELTTDFSTVSEWVKKIMEPAIVIPASA